MTNNKTILYRWLWLVILTFLSVFVGRLVDYVSDVYCINDITGTIDISNKEGCFKHQNIFIVCVLIIVFLKGQMIIDCFMELKHAPKRWRLLLMSYVVFVPSIIIAIYIL